MCPAPLIKAILLVINPPTISTTITTRVIVNDKTNLGLTEERINQMHPMPEQQVSKHGDSVEP